MLFAALGRDGVGCPSSLLGGAAEGAIKLLAVNPALAGNPRVSALGESDVGVNGGPPGNGVAVTEVRGVIVGYYRWWWG
ncbi:MAG: hypothetical protein GY713_02895 [Actinomycetia bacterium]|nr:hypothetical protein [Actinomycetes bacterium]